MELYVHELEKDVLVVAVDGGLNARTAEQFTVEVENVAQRGFAKIIVDCSALTFISSSGIGALLLLHRRMKQRGADVKVAGARSFVLDVLRMARLDGLFDLYPDVSRARLAFRSPDDEGDLAGLDLPARKARLRQRLKLALSAMTPESRRAASVRIVEHLRALPEWAEARTVLMFWPRVSVDERPGSGEPDIRPLIEDGLKAGKAIALPRVDWIGKSMSAALIASTSEDLEADAHAPGLGLYQPRPSCADAPLKAVDLVLLPGLGFDPSGRRIGRGAGFYDRLLERLTPDSSGPTLIGVCFDEQVVREVPVEEHDRGMSMVVSPSGVMRPGLQNER